MAPIKIIAEIANAHQGDLDLLEQLVHAAQNSGADAIKFQWFKYDCLATPDYQWYKVYEDLFFDQETWKKVLLKARDLGLEVWIDIFGSWGLELAREYVDLIDGFKLPPTVLQTPGIGVELVRLGKPLMIGVGGWYDEEISQALSTLNPADPGQITLMHGFQGYPTKTEDACLARLSYLRDTFKLPVGFADHEDAAKDTAIEVPVFAVMAGAKIIEKHLTLDRAAKGYDYYSSLEPNEFASMVSKIIQAQSIIGTAIVNEAQRAYLKDAPRVVAEQNLNAGEIMTLGKVTPKRCPDPDGLFPIQFKNLLPAVIQTTVQKNEAITSGNA